jgi:hypothetical protein
MCITQCLLYVPCYILSACMCIVWYELLGTAGLVYSLLSAAKYWLQALGPLLCQLSTASISRYLPLFSICYLLDNKYSIKPYSNDIPVPGLIFYMWFVLYNCTCVQTY